MPLVSSGRWLRTGNGASITLNTVLAVASDGARGMDAFVARHTAAGAHAVSIMFNPGATGSVNIIG